MNSIALSKRHKKNILPPSFIVDDLEDDDDIEEILDKNAY